MIAGVTGLFVLLCVDSPVGEAPAVLRPGDVIEGTIGEDDPPVRTAALDAFPDVDPRGKRYRVERSAPGPMFIELRSHLFDAYLVLRDADGHVLLEDANGSLNSHARLVIAADVDGPFLLDAVDAYGESGAFRLSVHAGVPTALSPADRRAAEIEDARESVRVRESVLGPDHPSLARTSYKLGWLLKRQGAYDEARPHYERALRITEATHGSEHPDTGMHLHLLALVVKAQGAYDEARPLYERALRITEAALGSEHEQTASILTNLAELLRLQGAYEQARPLFERALRIRERALGPEHVDTAISLLGVAAMLGVQGEYEQARPRLERALRVIEASLGPEHPITAQTLTNLAEVHRALGSYGEARPLYERALRIREAAQGPDHPETARSLSNLAQLLKDQGAYEEARLLEERALRITEASLGPEHPKTARNLHRLADVLRQLGEYDEARALQVRSYRIWKASLGPEHPDTAISLGALAGLLQRQGAYAEAQPLLERSLRILETSLGPSHHHTAMGLSNLSWSLRAQGAYEEARPLLERALRIHDTSLGPEHPHTMVSANDLALLEFNLGETERALTRSRATRSASAVHLRRVMWSLSESERLRFVRAELRHLDLLLSVARVRADDSSRRVGYEAVLAWKGQVARSLLRDWNRELRSLPEAERTLIERLRALQVRLSDAVYAREITEPDAHASLLKELRDQRNRLEVDLARVKGKGEAPAEDREEETRLAAVTSALPRHAAAIDFFVHQWYEPAVWQGDELVRRGRWTEEHLSAWVVRAGEPLVQLDLGPASIVEAAGREFLEEMVQRRGLMAVTEESDPTRTTKKNERLRALLWEPLAAAIGDARAVFVSGDSFLGTLPIETLQSRDGRYLIEDHTFTYLADMSSLPDVMTRREEREPTLFAAGGIDYRRRGDLDDVAEPDASPETDDRRGPLSRRWRPLDGTAGEVSAIADLHLESTEDAGTQRVLREREATEERVKESLSDYTHVHLATHGYFHPEGLPSAWKKIRERDQGDRDFLRETEQRVVGLLPGLLSGLVFAGANAKAEAGRDNGLLTAEEITTIDLSGCDLVVLSACETGLGRAEGGEGMLGLRRTFRMAGARTVISSLWEVSDTATRDLMTLFYENLWLDGQSKQDALRNAQLMMLEHNRERHGHAMPSTWGAFVLDGAPE